MANYGKYPRKVRNKEQRARKPFIFIAAEGNNKTETLYFQDFCKDHGHRLCVASGNATDPENMVRLLKSTMESQDFDPFLGDKAYCLIDADVDPAKNQQIAAADKEAKRAKIQVVVSAPCFEIWYLCHYVFSTRKYTKNTDVLSALERYRPSYSKGMRGLYTQTKELLNTAVQNAEKLAISCEAAGHHPHTTDFSPSTEVYLIAQEILELG